METQMSRSAARLERLEEAVATLWSEEAKQRARQLDVMLEGLSISWGEEDGEPYVEWYADAALRYAVKLYSF